MGAEGCTDSQNNHPHRSAPRPFHADTPVCVASLCVRAAMSSGGASDRLPLHPAGRRRVVETNESDDDHQSDLDDTIRVESDSDADVDGTVETALTQASLDDDALSLTPQFKKNQVMRELRLLQRQQHSSALDNRFSVGTMIAKGGFGAVFRGRDLARKRDVAMKLLDWPSDSASREFTLYRMIALHGPAHRWHILPLRKWFRRGPKLCLVFPLCGITLSDVLHMPDGGGMCLATVQQVARQLIAAVARLHELGIAHNDIKPGNVLLKNPDYVTIEFTSQGPPTRRSCMLPLGDPVVFLADFGLSMLREELPVTGRKIGTSRYMSPERTLRMSSSYPNDIWSLGCTLLEIFLGEPLFISAHDGDHERISRMRWLLGDAPDTMHVADPATWYTHHSGSAHRQTKATTTAAKMQKALRGPHSNTTTASGGAVARGLDATLNMSMFPLFHDLISRMLVWDPAQRITAAEAVKHPFLSSRNTIDLGDKRYRYGLGALPQYSDFRKFWDTERFMDPPPVIFPPNLHIANRAAFWQTHASRYPSRPGGW